MYWAGWMDAWLGFNGILNTQVAAISCLRKLKFISKANGVYKSCIEILANDNNDD